MFLDLETTGLSGGAGTVAFLVGIGFFENGAFRTRQFLLPGFASERALLHAVAECLGDAGCLVTYNGKTFDLPVMETRWLFHRQPLAWTDLTHLDMLHVVAPVVARARRRSGGELPAGVPGARSVWRRAGGRRARHGDPGALLRLHPLRRRRAARAGAASQPARPAVARAADGSCDQADSRSRGDRDGGCAVGAHRHQSAGAAGGRARVAAAASAECRRGLFPCGRGVRDGA